MENIYLVSVDGAEFTFEGGRFDEETFQRWTEKMEYYLKDTSLLLSTQDGTYK